jgi:universal stress protein E
MLCATMAHTSVVARSRYAQVLMCETTRWYEDEYRSIVDTNLPMKESVNRISHILVIVDPSAAGRQAAIDKAALLARCLNASVELLICDIASAREDHRLTPHPHTAPPSNTQLLDLLETLAAPLRAQGTEVALRIIYGKSLPDSLVDYLPDSKADLVIKDTHHHSFARRTFLRNTDWHLTRACTAPLLLTKAKPWSSLPIIMAAVDPNDANPRVAALDREILSAAATLTWRLKGHLHVIHTFVPTAFAAVIAAGGRSTTPEYSDALRAENSFRYSQIEQFVRAYGVAPEHLHVEMGTPEDCLSHLVAKSCADVVVIGASSHGRWHRMIVGSTTATILESLPCDILIVRPADEIGDWYETN